MKHQHTCFQVKDLLFIKVLWARKKYMNSYRIIYKCAITKVRAES